MGAGQPGARPSLDAGPGAQSVFVEKLAQDPAYFIAWVTIVAFSVCIHETAHAWCAWWQGDDTAVRSGYGDMDPRKLMGWSSLLALVLFGIAWGAVPVNPARFRRRWSDALVAGSGPGANLLLACLCGAGLALAGRLVPDAWPVHLVLECGLGANCLLAVLNLLPVPPFDGWPVACFLVPALRQVPVDRLNLASWVLIMLLLVTPASRVVYGIAGTLAGLIAGATSGLAG